MSKSSMVTNGKIRSMVANQNYQDGWDRIFGKKPTKLICKGEDKEACYTLIGIDPAVITKDKDRK